LIAAQELSLSPRLTNPIFNNEGAARGHFEATRRPESKPVSADCGTIDQGPVQ